MNEDANVSETKVFIGSSSEGLPFAEEIKIYIERDPSSFEVTLWTENVFEVGDHYLTSLEKALNKFDAAILVFTQDDILNSRDNEFKAPRDNVIFELGMFLGKLGRDNVFFTTTKDLKLPSDLNRMSVPEINWTNPNTEERSREEIQSAIRKAAPSAITKAANRLKMKLEEVHEKRLHPIEERDNNLYAIAWEGMEDDQLYKDTDIGPREFLLVRGSLENLPNLTYRHSGASKNKDFVNIVCDIEFLEGYWESGRIEKIDTKFSNKAQELLNQVLATNARNLSSEIFEFGIPIRFGFQEILVRRDRVEDGFLKMIDNGEVSYESLGIEDLIRGLKTKCKLGLWDVPQPTLCLMAALGFKTTYQSTDVSHKDQPGFWSQVFDRDTMQKQLRQNLSLLINSKDNNNAYNWEFLSDPRLVRKSLIEGRNDEGIGIVLGAGSWALKHEDLWDIGNIGEKGKVSILLPSEGVLTWIDCAAVMPIGEDPAGERKYELIRHWLKTSVQLDISKAVGGMHACPVTKNAIKDIINQKDDNIKHPSEKTLMRFIDPKETLEFPLRVAPRPEFRELWNCLKRKYI